MKQGPPATRCGPREFRWGEKTYVMGICNLSPDSFSGDGLGSDLEATIARAKRMVAEGADIIDVGGESTRPGTEPTPDVSAEIDLVVPAGSRPETSEFKPGAGSGTGCACQHRHLQVRGGRRRP